MKRFLTLALAASLGLFYAGTSEAVYPQTNANNNHTVANYPAGAAANGIGMSRHNLGSFGIHVVTNATTEICVFCHTPHHTNTNTAPLWNRSTAASSSYTAYGTTLAGTSITSVGGTSLACLSCHDGVTTFDNIVNAPGRGGVVAGGSDRGWSFYEGGLPQLDNITFSGRLNIGTSLSNDHPVSVDYLADRASLRPTNTVINSINLTADLTTSAQGDANLGQNRWAVKGYISDTATIADLLRSGKVECAGCHDPHFKNLSWDEVETYPAGELENSNDGLFLRRVGGNTASGVCRTCHNK